MSTDKIAGSTREASGECNPVQSINDALSDLTPKQHDKMLDMIKQALLNLGAKQVPIEELAAKRKRQ